MKRLTLIILTLIVGQLAFGIETPTNAQECFDNYYRKIDNNFLQCTSSSVGDNLSNVEVIGNTPQLSPQFHFCYENLRNGIEQYCKPVFGLNPESIQEYSQLTSYYSKASTPRGKVLHFKNVYNACRRQKSENECMRLVYFTYIDRNSELKEIGQEVFNQELDNIISESVNDCFYRNQTYSSVASNAMGTAMSGPNPDPIQAILTGQDIVMTGYHICCLETQRSESEACRKIQTDWYLGGDSFRNNPSHPCVKSPETSFCRETNGSYRSALNQFFKRIGKSTYRPTAPPGYESRIKNFPLTVLSLDNFNTVKRNPASSSNPTITRPPVEPTPVEPPAEPAPVEPPVEPAPVEPPVEPTPVEPPVEPTPVEPPAEPAPVESPAEPAPVEPPAEPAPVEPPAEPAPVEPPAEPAPVEPPITQNKCQDALIKYLEDPANRAKFDKYLEIQGQITLHRMAWSYLKMVDGKRGSAETRIKQLLKDRNPEMHERFLNLKIRGNYKNIDDAFLEIKKYVEEKSSPDEGIYQLKYSDRKMLELLAKAEELHPRGTNTRGVMNFLGMIESAYRAKRTDAGALRFTERILDQKLEERDEIQAEIHSILAEEGCGQYINNPDACHGDKADGRAPATIQPFLDEGNHILDSIYADFLDRADDIKENLEWGKYWLRTRRR